jgi:Mn-dependent DtxR family transcriptional regulator
MPATFKQFLERLTHEKAPGPSPSFSVYHLLFALALIGEKSVGRSKLAEELGVGEGAVRTLISRLREDGLIVTSKAGCSLTDKGLRLWKEYKSIFRIAEIKKNELTFDDCNFAIIVKNYAHKVRSGIEQRDAAVMAGAKGATTTICKKGRLIFPSTNNDVAKDFPRASNQIVRLLNVEENDVVIIVSSGSVQKAKYGALAAAWTLLDGS